MPSNILRLITVRMTEKITEIVEEYGFLGPEQFGFRKGRSTIDAAFVLSTLMQSAKWRRSPFVIAFLDISKVRGSLVLIGNYARLFILVI